MLSPPNKPNSNQFLPKSILTCMNLCSILSLSLCFGNSLWCSDSPVIIAAASPAELVAVFVGAITTATIKRMALSASTNCGYCEKMPFAIAVSAANFAIPVTHRNKLRFEFAESAATAAVFFFAAGNTVMFRNSYLWLSTNSKSTSGDSLMSLKPDKKQSDRLPETQPHAIDERVNI